MMFKRLTRNPYFIYLPFLLFYIYVIVINKWPTLYGDEIRYSTFAWRLLHGYYSPPAPYINLWNGPGYPGVIAIFMALRFHALYITLMNALFMYLNVVFLYQSIKLLANRKIALLFSLLLALYPNALPLLPILYTEAFTGFLVSAFVYAVTLYYTKRANKYAVIAGLLLGYLVLTKVIFGYVITLGLIVCLVMLLMKRTAFRKVSVKILIVAFAVTVPYLVYTCYITGKIFYWGNSGGMSLYWMSTPYDNEYGDWKIPELNNNQYPMLFKSPEGAAMLKKNHSKEITAILKHNDLEQDELFKQAAIRNIKAHPFKFVTNYYYNWARMLFNFPYTYSYQDAAIVGNIIRGSLLLWASVAGIILTVINWRKVVYPIKLALLITGIYLLLSGALSAYPRQLDVVVPVLLFWLGILVSNMRKLNLRFTEPEKALEEINLIALAGDSISDKVLD
jgi:4-amino-4-deoxy-L-arabinose transferase-like glycosyltransferase